MKKIWIVLTAFVILSMLLSACGGASAQKPVTLDKLTPASVLPQPDGRRDYQMIVDPVTNMTANQGVQTAQPTKYYIWFYGIDNHGDTTPVGINMQDIVDGKYSIAAIVFWPYGDPVHTKTGLNLYMGGIVGINQDFIKQRVVKPASLSEDAQKIMISLCTETAKAKKADSKYCTD